MKNFTIVDSLHYFSGEILYILPEGEEDIIWEVRGEKLQSLFMSAIENNESTLSDEILSFLISSETNSEHSVSSFGVVKVLSVENDFLEHDLKAYAKYPSSTSCPGTFGGMGQGSNMSDDNTCLIEAPAEP